MTHNMAQKHALVAEGKWNDRSGLMGVELRDRTFGAVGFGGIAQGVAKLLAPFGMNQIVAFDPYVNTTHVFVFVFLSVFQQTTEGGGHTW